jgi:hypothetical protein
MPQPSERHVAVLVDYRGVHPTVCLSESKTGVPIAIDLPTRSVRDCVRIVNLMLGRDVPGDVLERAVPDDPAGE